MLWPPGRCHNVPNVRLGCRKQKACLICETTRPVFAHANRAQVVALGHMCIGGLENGDECMGKMCCPIVTRRQTPDWNGVRRVASGAWGAERLRGRGLARVRVSESLAVRVGILLDKASHQFACRGTEGAKVVFKVENERGRRGLWFQVRVAVARGDETEGDQAQTEAN